jgi:hypothetical protein
MMRGIYGGSCTRGRVVTARRSDLVIHGKSSSSRAGPGVSNKVGVDHNLIYGKSSSVFAPLPPVTESQDSMSRRGQLAERDHSRVIRRYQLQAAARELLPREGVSKCMRSLIPWPDQPMGVDVLYAPLKGAAHYAGLQVCKSVWHCAVCSAKISERRREELTEALKIWCEQCAGETHRLLLVTFTLQHKKTDDLSVILKALIRARKLLVSGRGAKYMKETYQMVGMIRALEVTHGDSGWHPHLHCLYFFDAEVPIIPFETDMKERWKRCIDAAGQYASWQHGCDVRFSDADIAAYLAKWDKEPKWTPAHELAKAVSKTARKGGRTPLQLLSDYVDGDEGAGRLWLQYAVNFRGERQLYWTPKLRERLGLGKYRTDEEVAVEQEEIAVVLSSLSVGAWRVVIGNDARGELLEIASRNDVEALQQFLTRLGVGKMHHKGG